MKFHALPAGSHPPFSAPQRIAYLKADNWDDWGKFQTMYTLFVFDDSGERHEIGSVKIGQSGLQAAVRSKMESGSRRRADVPSTFETLPDALFSLGQDDSYYDSLKRLGDDIRVEVLTALRDIAFNLDLYESVLSEEVLGESLMRWVTDTQVRGQFHRIAQGGERHTGFRFEYRAPGLHTPPALPILDEDGDDTLSFTVKSDSNPPTNIHVIIGGNGVGKSRLLDNMSRALLESSSDPESETGAFSFPSGGVLARGEWSDSFANVVSVSFSAFDDFPLLEPDKSGGIRYSYIGLREKDEEGRVVPKNHPELEAEFRMALHNCREQRDRYSRWKEAVTLLEADPIFDEEIRSLGKAVDDPTMSASDLLRDLSSGHKIILLTVTELVLAVEERTLVLLDEPESHLHPPLLSAFLRALSNLMKDRNGVAIIATHSPVVLQEVPTSCVYKMRRSGDERMAERLNAETFGENVGVLTREAFGLEVAKSGFHELLRYAVEDGLDYEGVLERFHDQLGVEGRAIARVLIAERREEEA